MCEPGGRWWYEANHYGIGQEYSVRTMLAHISLAESYNEFYFFRMCRTPCGFCFVEFYTHAEALACMRYVSGTKLDERVIRCDLDLGYKEGRQFGRGKSGGQVRFISIHHHISE